MNTQFFYVVLLPFFPPRKDFVFFRMLEARNNANSASYTVQRVGLDS